MFAGEQINFQLIGCAGRPVCFFKPMETGHGPVNYKAGIIKTDINQERFGRNQPLQIRQVNQLEQV